MTTERDPATRTVLSWLQEDAHEDAERVLLRALEQVDSTPQRRRPWPVRGLADMTSVAKLAIAAAAVVLIVVAGIQFLPRSGTSGGGPSPTPTPTPAFPQLTEGPLPPGRYALYDGLVTSVEVPAGWVGKPPFVRKTRADASGLWWGPGETVSAMRIFSDACHGPALMPVVATARGLVDALDAQVGTKATITEATLGGLPATRVELVKDPASCAGGASADLQIWSNIAGGGRSLAGDARGIFYVLDHDGDPVFFIGVDYKASPSDRAELEAVIASTQFGP